MGPGNGGEKGQRFPVLTDQGPGMKKAGDNICNKAVHYWIGSKPALPQAWKGCHSTPNEALWPHWGCDPQVDGHWSTLYRHLVLIFCSTLNSGLQLRVDASYMKEYCIYLWPRSSSGSTYNCITICYDTHQVNLSIVFYYIFVSSFFSPKRKRHKRFSWQTKGIRPYSQAHHLQNFIETKLNRVRRQPYNSLGRKSGIKKIQVLGNAK